jgi:hypothetical protein
MLLTKEWITGFVDGDGCFSIQTQKEKYLRHRFVVSQDVRSVDVLYALKKEFGCGSVHKAGGNMMEFVIEKRSHLRDHVIPHFYKYPLQTKKRLNFHSFVSSLWKCMIEKEEEPGAPPMPLDEGYKLSDGWFRGFVDAEGSFVCALVENRPIPQFLLGLSEVERPLLEECKRWLKCGTCRATSKGAFFYQIADTQQMEQILFPLFETRGSAVLLRTMKRISFQKFRKIVRIIKEKKHVTPEGLEKIKQLRIGLNKQNDLLNNM